LYRTQGALKTKIVQ